MWKKYIYDDADAPPLASPEESPHWDSCAVRAAGEREDDEEISLSRLTTTWRGHPAGSRVVIGLTANGHPFAVETQRRAAG